MKTIFFLLFTLFNCFVKSQTVTNLVFVGDDGITEDFSKAKAFIIIKKYPDHFERLDYNKAGPIIKSRSYKDAELKILEGKYCEYLSDGSIVHSGNYLNNKKDGNWHTYDDYGKVIYTEKYAADSIIDIPDLFKEDTVIINVNDREATFPGGQKAWRKYLTKSLESGAAKRKSSVEGEVSIAFKIDLTGALSDVTLVKSVEYALDNESIQIIANSPIWTAALQNGKPIFTDIIQHFTFARPEYGDGGH